jgi:hypothetical protein
MNQWNTQAGTQASILQLTAQPHRKQSNAARSGSPGIGFKKP